MTALSPKKCTIEIGEDSYTGDITNWTFSAADSSSDTTTFEEADQGGAKDVTFNATFIQDDGDASLWSYLYDNPGADCTITVMPQGNAVPSATQPHWTATGTVPRYDGDFMGGDANADKRARWTASIAIPCDGFPTKVTAATP